MLKLTTMFRLASFFLCCLYFSLEDCLMAPWILPSLVALNRSKGSTVDEGSPTIWMPEDFDCRDIKCLMS